MRQHAGSDTKTTRNQTEQREETPSCPSTTLPTPAPLPPGARNLIWDNPDGVTQEDVFLVRGSLVYRVGTVTERQKGLATVNRLAFALPEIMRKAVARGQ